MQTERPFVHELAVKNSPRSIGELFKSIRQAAEHKENRILLEDMTSFLNLMGLNVESKFTERPQEDKLLIVAPNHFSRSNLFTTRESFIIASAVTIAAHELELSQKHLAWFFKRLKVGLFDFGRFRETQNAASRIYNVIPVELNKRGKLANEPEMKQAIAESILSGHNIGIFPEQKPTTKLKPFHEAFTKFLKQLVKQNVPFQILPTSIYFENKNGHLVFGRIIDSSSSNPVEIAHQTMIEIARNLPKKLQGKYQV